MLGEEPQDRIPPTWTVYGEELWEAHGYQMTYRFDAANWPGGLYLVGRDVMVPLVQIAELFIDLLLEGYSFETAFDMAAVAIKL